MAIVNFVPEIWSAALLKALRDRLTYAQAGVINRNYEGDIARAGDTVHITSFADPDVRSYTKFSTDNQAASVTYDALDDSTRALIIDQADYFGFAVDDVDKRQALPGFIDETTTGASYNMAAEADDYVAGLMVAGVDVGNQLGSVSLADPEDAYELLVELRTKLTRTNTPDDGRFVVIPPEMYGLLLKDDRFIRQDASGTTAGLRNGQAGRAAGFDVIESNRAPVSGGGWTVLAGHSIATTFAEQISQVEALRLQGHFADAIRGLHLYGAKVLRGANLASANVTVTGATPPEESSSAGDSSSA